MKEKKILWIIIFNLIIIVSEVTFGLISNSFALIADALHNAGDVIAIIITYIALKFGNKKPTYRYTFGFLRAEMMAGFVNTLFLFATMLYLIYEAFTRLLEPEAIEPQYMIVMGLIAVAANGISAYLLSQMQVSSCHHHDHGRSHDHHHDEDVNIRSAYLHMLSDALVSVGVVLAGIFIYYFGIYYVDSALAILFSIYILFHSYPLLKKSFFSLMDANTVDITEKKLGEIIMRDSRVIQYHDLHIHKPNSKNSFVSFHIVVDDDALNLIQQEDITATIKHTLEHAGFSHILIQVDSIKALKSDKFCDIITEQTNSGE